MIEPLNLNTLGDFLQNIISVYDQYIYFTFVIFIAFNVAYGVSKLILGRSI